MSNLSYYYTTIHTILSMSAAACYPYPMKTIDKLGWIHIKDRKALFVRSKDKPKPFIPGGKREEGESDEQALIREIQEELSISLIPETIKPLTTIIAQAHGMPEGVNVQIKCHTADFTGDLTPSAEIEEYVWLDSSDIPNSTEPGKLCLAYLKEHNLID